VTLRAKRSQLRQADRQVRSQTSFSAKALDNCRFDLGPIPVTFVAISSWKDAESAGAPTFAGAPRVQQRSYFFLRDFFAFLAFFAFFAMTASVVGVSESEFYRAPQEMTEGFAG
jgi:hypothetical protein